MINTNAFGLFSVNRETFNTKYHETHGYPIVARNFIMTLLRIHNAVLNILGYIPITSPVSGCLRIATGVAIIGFTIVFGNRNAPEGLIIGRWYDEAIITGIAQIARGVLEAFVPFGWVANATLDIIATPFNISKEVTEIVIHKRMMYEHGPHEDIHYPFPFWLLYLA